MSRMFFPPQNQRISKCNYRHDYRHGDLILYHSSLICKSAQGVHNTVRNNTRPQASAFMEYGHKEKADRSGIDDLAYVGNQFHSTPIKQINNMPYSKQNTGNYNGSFNVALHIALNSSPLKINSSRKPTRSILPT